MQMNNTTGLSLSAALKIETTCDFSFTFCRVLTCFAVCLIEACEHVYETGKINSNMLICLNVCVWSERRDGIAPFRSLSWCYWMKRLLWELTAWQPSIHEAACPAVLAQRQLHLGLRSTSFTLDLCGLMGKRRESIVQNMVRNKFKDTLIHWVWLFLG